VSVEGPAALHTEPDPGRSSRRNHIFDAGRESVKDEIDSDFIRSTSAGFSIHLIE
jgi:hypothetical protein